MDRIRRLINNSQTRQNDMNTKRLILPLIALVAVLAALVFIVAWAQIRFNAAIHARP